MKFEELSKDYQEFLMYCLFNHIKRKVKEEERDKVIEPTYECIKLSLMNLIESMK